MKKALVVLAAVGVVFALWGLSVAAVDEVQELKGDAGCAMCAFKSGGCAAAVKIGDDVFALKASDKASNATKELIASFKGAAKTTKVAIKGVVKDKAVIADEVTKVEEKKEE
ncbi:MAG TPA: hypothetical protein VNE39_28125 [Planctomycetota bacterium]|nr:hypothetical protein [Planctomycetota bacterium]